MVVDDSQTPVILGEEIARGGEGLIRRITHSSEVAKLYHKPIDGTKLDKLKILKSSNSDGLRQFAALPTRLLWERNRPIGFAMPAINSRIPVYKLTSPKTRRTHFGGKDYRFLVCVAQNIAKAFASIHAAGLIIGDVNESGVFVGADGLVSLIDCDSYQVRSGGSCYLCEVGVPMFTPPELQGKDLRTERTSSHDSFGLSVLLFTLLFMGRHPFSGRFKGSGEMPIERAIAERRFAFLENSNSSMSPPPNALLLREVGPLAEPFVRSFCTIDRRPTDREWIAALEEFRCGLKRCPSNGAHYFPSWANNCPWCRIEGETGVLLFAVIRIGAARADRTVDVAAIWAKIERVQRPAVLPFPQLVRKLPPSSGTNNLRQRVFKRRITQAYWFAPAVASLLVVWAQPMFGIVIFIVAFLIGLNRAQRVTELTEITAMRTTAARCRGEIESLKRDWACSELLKTFDDLKANGGTLKDTLTALPSQRAQKLAALEKDKYRHQLHAYLDGFPIERAASDVPGIGRGRITTLRAYQVFTAADLTPTLKVPGFGPTYMGRLREWRRNLEAQFRFDPNRSVDKNLINQIETEYASKMHTTLSALNQIPQRLEHIRATFGFRTDEMNERAQSLSIEYSQLLVDAGSIRIRL